jgi:putative transcription factor
MNHQDWNLVVIHGKTAKSQTSAAHPHREVTKEQKLDQTELGTHKKVGLTMAKAIQNGRIAKGFQNTKRFSEWRSEFQRT